MPKMTWDEMHGVVPSITLSWPFWWWALFARQMSPDVQFCMQNVVGTKP